jgi:metal-responsive CopG/Arc/MetJ family transcriptional regulator
MAAKRLDQMSREQSCDRRSLAVADGIRDQLVEHHHSYGDCGIAGTITLVYDHHKQYARKLGDKTILASLMQKTI